MSTNSTVKLRRTGLAPLIFKGEQLASVSGQYLHNRANNRWWELSVYRSETEHYVLQVSFYTNWQGEVPAHEVCVCESPSEVCDWLARTGFFLSKVLTPLGEDAAKVGPVLKQQLHYLITDLCEELGDEFAEELQEEKTAVDDMREP